MVQAVLYISLVASDTRSGVHLPPQLLRAGIVRLRAFSASAETIEAVSVHSRIPAWLSASPVTAVQAWPICSPDTPRFSGGVVVASAQED